MFCQTGWVELQLYHITLRLSLLMQRIAHHAVAVQAQDFAVSKQLSRSKTSGHIEGVFNIESDQGMCTRDL